MENSNYLEMIYEWLQTYSLNLGMAVLIFLVGRWLARKMANLLGVFLAKGKVDETLVGFLRNISYYALLVLVLIAAADQLGINTTSFLTIVGAAGLAVGLALKDSLANFAAGVLLILFRPFRVGDFVSAGGVEGAVETISIFSTVMKTPDNRKVIVPNGKIINEVITNVTANPTRRVDLVIGIDYQDNIGRAKEILAGLLKDESRILPDPAPFIGVVELADSSVNLAVRSWVNSGDYWGVYVDLLERIKTTFDQEGITIPFPQRQVHLRREGDH